MSQKYKPQTLRELFRTLNQAELNSNNIKDHSIVYMGLSRAGKSALMNWQFHPQSIIGKRVGTNTFYVQRDTSSPKNPEEALKIAKIGHGFASVTIMANIRVSQINKILISILDFGGFGERRNAHQIIKVNYVLATFLLKMKKVKFVLVVTQHAFNDISSNGLRDTLGEFVRLFDFQAMSQNNRVNFLKSISLCITSTTRRYEQSEIVEQLRIIIQNFEDKSLYDEQTNENSYIQKYPVCKMILETLIATRRFQFFPLAEVDKSPSKCPIISSFNSKKWQFFDLRSSRESICYPYVQQFYKLKENEKEKIKTIVTQRFNLIKKINVCIKQMVKKLYQNICSNDISFQEQFKQLANCVEQNQFYQDMPICNNNQFNSYTFEMSWLQRLHKLIELYNINESILLYSLWLGEQKDNHLCQDKYVDYYTYLRGKLTQQLDILYMIFGSSPDQQKKRQKMKILIQLGFIIEKSLKESLIFQNLNKYVDNNQIANQCRMSNYQNIHFGDAFTDSVQALKLQYFRQLYNPEINYRQIKVNQIDTIIKYICDCQKELSDMDSAMVNSICSRLAWAAATEEFQLRGAIVYQKVLSWILKGLQFCIKQQLCLETHENKDATERLISQEKKYITCLADVLQSMGHRDVFNLAIDICKKLKQYSILSRILSKRSERQPNNIELLRVWAQYQRSIGNGEAAIKVNQKIQGITRVSYRLIIDQILNQGGHNYQVSMKHQAEESQMISKQQLVQLIDQIRKKILDVRQTYSLNFDSFTSQYKQRMKKIIINKTYEKDLPKYPNNYEYLYYTNQIIKLVANKKITIMLKPGPLRGQTTLAYALTNSRLNIKVEASLSQYDLVDNQNQSRINNDGNNPTEYPFIRSVNDDEMIVDFNNIFQSNAQKKILGSIMLQTMIEKCEAYRFIFVQNEKDVLENNGKEMVNFLKLLMSLFKWDFSQPQNCQRLSSIVYFFVTFVTKRPQLDKKLRQICSKMKDKQSMIENEKNYGLTQTDQLQLHYILNPLVKNKKETFDCPKIGEQTLKKNDWIKELQNCRVCLQPNTICSHPRWKYIHNSQFRPEICLQIVNLFLFGTEIKIILGHISKMIQDARRIVEDMFTIVKKNYSASLLNSFQPEKLNHSEQVLLFLYHLLQIKKIITNRYKERLYYLPDEYAQFYSMLKSFYQHFFKCIKNCLEDSAYCSTIKKNQCQFTKILYQLQYYSLKLGLSDKMQFRQKLVQIRRLESDIQWYFEDISIDDLIKEFFKKVKLEQILQRQKYETKQCMLSYYRGIEKEVSKNLDIQQLQQYTTVKQWVDNNRSVTKAIIQKYLKTGRKKQAIQLQISTVKQLIDYSNKSEYLILIEQTSEEILQEASSILSDVAVQLVVTHPKLSKDICIVLKKKERLLKILQMIFENNKTNITQKINNMVQRIILNQSMERAQEVRSLLRNLQTLTKGHQLGDNFKNIYKLLEYAEKNHLKFLFPQSNSIKKETLVELVSIIQKQNL